MEDASKAIELAVGVIIFIVALTIAILLYNNLADTANNTLTINETQNSVVFNKDNIPSDFGYIYTPEDIYYFIQDIRENASDPESIYRGAGIIEIRRGHVYNNSINKDIMDDSFITVRTKNNIESSEVYGIEDSNSRYKIKYDYEYNEKDVLTELNNHKLKKIYIIQYVETF